jgi:nitrogen fixation NifU-like protein
MTEDDLDSIADDIQKRIMEQEAKRFSARVLKEAREPNDHGRIEAPDSQASIKGPCGDTMEFSLTISEGHIKEIRFMTDGCGSSIACGSITTRMVKGKSLEEAVRISDRDILRELGGLPEENRHCAKLASDTLQKAISDYRAKEER